MEVECGCYMSKGAEVLGADVVGFGDFVLSFIRRQQITREFPLRVFLSGNVSDQSEGTSVASLLGNVYILNG